MQPSNAKANQKHLGNYGCMKVNMLALHTHASTIGRVYREGVKEERDNSCVNKY